MHSLPVRRELNGSTSAEVGHYSSNKCSRRRLVEKVLNTRTLQGRATRLLSNIDQHASYDSGILESAIDEHLGNRCPTDLRRLSTRASVKSRPRQCPRRQSSRTASRSLSSAHLTRTRDNPLRGKSRKAG